MAKHRQEFLTGIRVMLRWDPNMNPFSPLLRPRHCLGGSKFMFVRNMRVLPLQQQTIVRSETEMVKCK